jgi:septal ring factor EnvC (AmiA/AmiB activator)
MVDSHGVCLLVWHLPAQHQRPPLNERAHGVSDISQSNTDISQSNTDISQSNTDISQSNTDISQSKTDISQSKTDISQSTLPVRYTSCIYNISHQRYILGG